MRAVLEHIERRAQFDPPVHPRTEWGSYRSLGPVAVEPSEFGLYTRLQCSRPGFGLAPHHPDAPLHWVPAVDLLTGNDRLVPIEFVYPRAPLVRLPIVAETSSGTAAHFDAELALQGALLELAERDAAMIFWYRQPRTTIVQVESVPVPELREELRAVQELGFVVALCHLASDIGLPCFLVLALRGARVAYGLGCSPSHGDAVAHALRELGARRQGSRPPSSNRLSHGQPLPRCQVRCACLAPCSASGIRGSPLDSRKAGAQTRKRPSRWARSGALEEPRFLR